MKETIESNKSTANTEIDTLTHDSIYYLRITAPWVKFISFAGFIMFIVLIAYAVLIIEAPAEGTNVYLAKLNSGMKNFIALIDILIAIIILMPSIYLFLFANRLKKFIKTNNYISLEKAFSIQKKFWKYIGVITILILSIFGITIIGLFAGIITDLFMK